MKRVLCLLLTLVLVLCLLPVSALASTLPQKDGEVYLVSTYDELLWIAEQVNGGSNTAIQVKLMADITLPSGWPGIGTSDYRFSGSFDGDGHVVTFNGSSKGLFGWVMGQRGDVASIANITTAGSVGATPIAQAAGYVHITRCINTAAVDAGSGKIGGIVGNVLYERIAGVPYTDVTLTQCGNEGAIKGYSDIGGLVGYTELGTVLERCYNTGAVTGQNNVGGLVGYMQNQNGSGFITYCYNTGSVSGENYVAGIIGNMMNSVTVSHSYNSGETYYAFAGVRYNHTARFGEGCYFLGLNSYKCSPDATTTLHHDHNSYEISSRAIAKSAAEMATAEFAAALGNCFTQSCPTPVLSWQAATPHTGESDCSNCAFGSTAKESYNISYQQHTAFTLSGPATVVQGDSLTVRLTLTEGYKRNSLFAVKANGTKLTETEEGTFVSDNVSGPLSITVTGVQQRKEAYDIQWSDVGNGYRIVGDALAPENQDYTFALDFVDGFQPAEGLFRVEAHEIVDEALLKQGAQPDVKTLTQDLDGSYTIESVNSDYRIVVTGVGTSSTKTVTVNFQISEGYYELHTSDNPSQMMAGIELEVPYFDLGLYGLGKYYYNPNCYMTDGVVNGRQLVGNPELAYENITAMHAFIVATERFRMGYSQEEVGKALHRTTKTGYENAFNDLDKAQTMVSWSQDVGSSFMNFWTHGTNLNYYVNYVYPIGAPGWGATSDQTLLQDGDDLSIHLITGAGSGSRFGLFTVNDWNKKFAQDDVRDEYILQQGQKIDLTLYWTANGPGYSTTYEKQTGVGLYWIPVEEASADIRDWNKTEFGTEFVPPEDWQEGDEIPFAMSTDSTGTVTIDTASAAPGVYYIAAPGGYSAKGAMNADDETSAAEAGLALFKLTVLEYTGLIGDSDEDKVITAKDATRILRYVVGKATLNDAVADVDADGEVTAKDATMVLRYVAGKIEFFPAEE